LENITYTERLTQYRYCGPFG